MWPRASREPRVNPKTLASKIVIARDRQTWRESRISGAMRGQSKSAIKKVTFISGGFSIAREREGRRAIIRVVIKVKMVEFRDDKHRMESNWEE